jgi:hypothetical protein
MNSDVGAQLRRESLTKLSHSKTPPDRQAALVESQRIVARCRRPIAQSAIGRERGYDFA